jgi:hypothetical protein
LLGELLGGCWAPRAGVLSAIGESKTFQINGKLSHPIVFPFVYYTGPLYYATTHTNLSMKDALDWYQRSLLAAGWHLDDTQDHPWDSIGQPESLVSKTAYLGWRAGDKKSGFKIYGFRLHLSLEEAALRDEDQPGVDVTMWISEDDCWVNSLGWFSQGEGLSIAATLPLVLIW